MGGIRAVDFTGSIVNIFDQEDVRTHITGGTGFS